MGVCLGGKRRERGRGRVKGDRMVRVRGCEAVRGDARVGECVLGCSVMV